MIDEIFYISLHKIKNFKKQNISNKNIEFCYELLDKVSRSFSTIIKNIPQPLSLEVAIFYLMLRALDTVEDDVQAFNGDKNKKKNYLINFYTHFTPLNNIGEEIYRPLLQNYHIIGVVFSTLNTTSQNIILDIVKKMGMGMSKFVFSNKIDTIDEYNRYCYIVAGLVGEGLVKLFCNNNYENSNFENYILNTKSVYHTYGGLDKSMGLFLQKTNIIRDYLEDINENKYWWPSEIWSKYTDNIINFKNSERNYPSVYCLNNMILDAMHLIPDIIQFHENVNSKVVFNFCLTPIIMAIATLDKCFNNENVFKTVVKIRKSLSLKIMYTCRNNKDMYNWIYLFTSSIKNKIKKNDPNKLELNKICNKILHIIYHKNKKNILTKQIISYIILLIILVVLIKIMKN